MEGGGRRALFIQDIEQSTGGGGHVSIQSVFRLDKYYPELVEIFLILSAGLVSSP